VALLQTANSLNIRLHQQPTRAVSMLYYAHRWRIWWKNFGNQIQESIIAKYAVAISTGWLAHNKM